LTFLTLNRLMALAAVSVTAAAVGFACSSTSSGAPFMIPAPAGDAAAADGAVGTSDDASEDAPATPPVVPCDAAIDLPTDGATASACSKCLEANCMPALAICEKDCVCTQGIECLAANSINYTLCPTAMSAIGAGNAGLTALGQCIPMSCQLCYDVPDGH
jgi:hypothetical protein